MNPVFVAILLAGFYTVSYHAVIAPVIGIIYDEIRKNYSQEDTSSAEDRRRNRESQELRSQLREARREKEELHGRLRDLENWKREHEQNINEREQEERKLKTQLEERNQDKQELRRRLEACEKEKVKSRRTVKRLKEEIKIFKQREDDYKQDEMRFRRRIRDATRLDRYNMDKDPRGICLVINNVDFPGRRERVGAETDEQEIVNLFRDQLHFKMEVHHNLSASEIRDTAKDIAAIDHSQYSAFVCIIMSHGTQDDNKKDIIEGIAGERDFVFVEELMSEFTETNCDTLRGKPKLFFIQACRGQKVDLRMDRLPKPARNTTSDGASMMASPDSALANGVTALEADFLLAHATVPGYIAWRWPRKGSWFIQELVKVIRKYHRDCHLLDMLTEVIRRVADIPNVHSENPTLSFQVPALAHTLTKQCFF